MSDDLRTALEAVVEYDEADEQTWGEAEPRDGIEEYAREVDPFFHPSPPRPGG